MSVVIHDTNRRVCSSSSTKSYCSLCMVCNSYFPTLCAAMAIFSESWHPNRYSYICLVFSLMLRIRHYTISFPVKCYMACDTTPPSRTCCHMCSLLRFACSFLAWEARISFSFFMVMPKRSADQLSRAQLFTLVRPGGMSARGKRAMKGYIAAKLVARIYFGIIYVI